jgi:glucuronate isomerase
MKKSFMDADVLLTGPVAVQLYHGAAEDTPLFDYSSHLNVEAIALNSQYENLTHLMLAQDHCKWRLMLTDGTEEDKIRGSAADWEKFLAYAKALQGAIGNPLYHMTHLEFQRIFDISEPLDETSARHIWDACNEKLQSPEFSTQGLLNRFKVHTVYTAEDPLSELKAHQRLRSNAALQVKVRPAFCPNRALQIKQAGFVQYISNLGEVSGQSINSLPDFLSALEKRIDFFHAQGCRSADHAMETVPRVDLDEEKADKTFRGALTGQPLKCKQVAGFQSLLYVKLGQLYARRNWVQQYRIGSMHDINRRVFALYGSDSGFESASDEPFARNLSLLLDAQDKTLSLPKTIIYCANPADNPVIASIIGNFQQAGIACKMQMGLPSHFQRQHDCIRTHLQNLAGASLLKHHLGMTSDSHSIAGLSRHEYFRRILCDIK